MALAGKYNFKIQRGGDFSRPFVRTNSAGVPTNLTGLKVRAQFRELDGETGTSTSETLVLELTDGNGISITDAVNGEITLELTNAQSRLLNPDNLPDIQVAYGIEIYDDSASPEVVTPFLQGKVTIKPETVRSDND